MVQKRKSNSADVITDLVSLMPWWVGVALAVGLYLWLHGVATQVVTITAGKSALPAVFKGIASVGQYILPALCLVGAAMSAFGRSKRKSLLRTAADENVLETLERITWRDFEMLVGESFRLQGYSVAETGGGGADGGIDLVLRRGSEKFLVQCKQWKAFNVGVVVVRELYGVMAAQGATGGFVVTSGQFSKDAKEFADGRNVKLIDGPALLKMIKSAQVARRDKGRDDVGGQAVATAGPALASGAAPACPLCSKAMVRRVAKKGSNAGQTFWGCTGYPACKGTRPFN